MRQTAEHTWRWRHSLWVLSLILLWVALLRLPVLWQLPGGQDEEWYGIPGLLVLQQGFPSVPYARATDPDSVFLGAETALFAMPPLFFYAQAPFFAVLPDTYGTARMASFVSGCVILLLVFWLGRLFFQDDRIALVAAALLSVSRLFYFPALSARPDMLCGLLGILSLGCMAHYQQRQQLGWLIAAGLSLGLAGLTHPMALVFAVQLGIWSLLCGDRWQRRLRQTVWLGLATLSAFSLWLPLILRWPDLFRTQFVANILRPAGPGLLTRLIQPGDSLASQLPQLVDRAHPVQLSLLVSGLLLSCGPIRRSAAGGWRACWLLAVSGSYLLIVFVGVHPIQGFWVGPAALAWLCTAAVLVRGCDRLPVGRLWRGIAAAGLGTAVAVCFLPGSGLRTTQVTLQHWNQPNWSSPQFVRGLLQQVPPAARLIVGAEYALDVWAAGRPVILGTRHDAYFDCTQQPADYVILGRRGIAEGLREAWPGPPWMILGDLDDPFANYAEIYRIESPRGGGLVPAAAAAEPVAAVVPATAVQPRLPE